jgi:hypothetical protein
VLVAGSEDADTADTESESLGLSLSTSLIRVSTLPP